jgi:serine/threonine protein kinase
MLGMLGRGGMGAVYRARQVSLDREVAIKLLPLEVSADQAFADRFVREARAMAKLNHPNIITVFGFGTTAEGHLYFFMEYVAGANVAQIIREPGLDPAQALVIMGQVCTALAYAHGKGVVHRDIKPANLLVRDGRMLLIDFSFAEVRPSPWRQAVDLANMMLVLALRSDPRKVYERAQVFFTVDEIAEAFAATRGLTMPSQLRRLMRAQGRDLHVEFKRLLPIQISPIAIQRWSWRRVLLVLTAVGVGLVAVLIIAQLLTSPL